jgi:SAM-dependent methyltransferase
MTTRPSGREARAGFGLVADAYERGRPDYPPALVGRLVDLLGGRPRPRILDLGAGTGKLTRRLTARGLEVVAVEPEPAMRDRLAGTAPDADVLAGVAEAIPLPDGSVDGAVAAQAFHWFRPDEALVELHRVLRPGGRLALVWNVRDVKVGWVHRLGRMVEALAGDVPRYRAGTLPAGFRRTRLFGPVRHERFRHVQVMDRAEVRDRVASVSYVAAAPAAVRDALLADVDHLLATHRATRGQDRFELPYITDLWWADRVGVT